MATALRTLQIRDHHPGIRGPLLAHALWQSVVTVLLLLAPAVAWTQTPRAQSAILLQTSLTAGLRHHEAKAVWDDMRVGDRLQLVREPDNPYDRNAVRVEWNGHMLGYIPRSESEALARQLDRGNKLEARITNQTRYRNHRRKLEVEIFLAL